jgi:hypothetical protein
MAMGVGYSLHYGLGENYWLKAATKNLSSRIGDAGLGITMDSNLAKDKLLNYRMDLDIGVSYDMYKSSSDFFKYHNAPFFAINTVHTLGFGIYRSKTIRLWLGPQISLGGLFGAPTVYGGIHKVNNTWGVNGGIGGALGLNVNIGEVFTIAFTGAVRGEGVYKNHSYQKYTGYDAFLFYSTPLYIPMVLYPEERREDSGIRVYGQFNLSFIFRINDAYSAAQN